MVVVQNHVLSHLAAKLPHLCLNDGGKSILDAAVEDLISGGDKAVLLGLYGYQLHNGHVSGCRPGGFHTILFDDQGNDAGTAELVALPDHEAGGARGNHHIAEAVHRAQTLEIDQKQAVNFGRQLDFAFLRFGGEHMLVHADVAENIGCVVFMKHAFIVFPDINSILSDAQQDRDVLGLNYMALAEHGVLGHAADNLGNVVAEDLPDGFFGLHEFHRNHLRIVFKK